jgi:hypothetical protein
VSEEKTIESWRPKLEPAAEAAIKELEASTGKPVTPVNVLWLQAAAGELVRPDRESPKLCDLPVAVGGALLWPMSYWAREWYVNVAQKAYGMDPRALAFTLAHSFDKETLQGIATRAQLHAAINAWLDTLLCAPAALRDALDRVLGRDELVTIANPSEAPAHAARASDWGDVIALLCEKYPGTEPLWWASRVSIDYCAEMAQRATAELPGDKNPSFNAVAKFHCVVDHIRKGMTPAIEPAVTAPAQTET